MIRPPKYFDSIRTNASSRWDQLERDPELAGPWRLLFQQVQSPRHVVSELLQNADDAGATQAEIRIENGTFVFSHNGNDFDQEQFASLCRFGFSNKRRLHTIGFRGVGFKSTFSLGDEVRLITPTLSVVFHRDRFTEPIWIESREATGRTEIQVDIKSEALSQELENNIQEWRKNPASLLFFNNIRSLKIHDQEIRWRRCQAGPIAGSEWMSLSDDPDEVYLLVRSIDEEFPEDSAQEIKEERMTLDDDLEFPPCRVELVLGMQGRLFVVLPTGVVTDLPFACNAPFIQDPARMKIKDPVISPTNRWLLQRAGELAADAMLAWVNHQAPSEERCRAYGLLPDVDRSDRSIDGTCGTEVEKSFAVRIQGSDLLLTETDVLVPAGNCMAVPSKLLDVWSAVQLSEEFSDGNKSILSRHVSSADRRKMIKWQLIKSLDKRQILSTLATKNIPLPKTWWQVVRLWNYVAENANMRISWRSEFRELRIVPVQGQNTMFPPTAVVRLGERSTLTPSDQEFLSPYLSILDPAWMSFLSLQRRLAQTNGDEESDSQLATALGVLRFAGLDEASSVNRLFSSVAQRFFALGSTRLIRDYVRLAHIAAKLGVNVPPKFKYVTQNCKPRAAEDHAVVADVDSYLNAFVDEEWYEANVLHGDYGQPSESCSLEELRRWLRSADSRVHTFVPLTETEVTVWGRINLVPELQRRGIRGNVEYHYRRDDFRIVDWDFDEIHWEHWRSSARGDDQFWADLMTRVLSQPVVHWSQALRARAYQLGLKYRKPVTSESLVPNWIIKFRDLPYLPNTFSQPCKPSELLRRTPATEPLLGIEHFIRSELDTPDTAPLLDLLGVSDKPTGPEKVLERLKSLANSAVPLVPEIQKWCHSLDQLFDTCTTEEIVSVKSEFAEHALILTDQNEWAKIDEVFLSGQDDDVPGAVVVHSALRELTLWRKIGVAERPTAEMELAWLKGLPSYGEFTPTQNQRIRRLLPSHPELILKECGHWLNLQGDWVPVDELEYCLTMQSLVRWSHLHTWVKSKTADFQMLSAQTCQTHPFSTLKRLGDVIQERFQGQSTITKSHGKPWIGALGNGLSRVVLEDEDITKRIQGTGRRLEQTRWQVAGDIRSMPYIDGKPAGTERQLEVYWQQHTLYARDSSPAKLAKAIPAEIGRVFDRQDITDAIKLCYERSEEFIEEYLDEAFELAPLVETEPESQPVQNAPTLNGHDHEDEMSNDENHDAEPDHIGIEHPRWPEESDNDLDGEYFEDDGHPQEITRRRRRKSPSLIERFAKLMDFSSDGNGKFSHSELGSLEPARDNAFPWKLTSLSGELIQYYWLKEHCIQLEPLEIDAEIWEHCERSPNRCALILIDETRNPIEISGGRLLEMRDRNELVLFPAAYRLKYADDAGK